MNKPTIRPTTNGVFPILDNGIHTVALGNGTQVELVLYRQDASSPLAVGIIGGRCYSFNHAPCGGYVAEKFGLGYGDAANLADFIACQLLEPHAAPFGGYLASLCADETRK